MVNGAVEVSGGFPLAVTNLIHLLVEDFPSEKNRERWFRK